MADNQGYTSRVDSYKIIDKGQTGCEEQQWLPAGAQSNRKKYDNLDNLFQQLATESYMCKV